MSVGESLYIGIQTLLVGMLVTFVGLTALQFIIRIMTLITRGKGAPAESCSVSRKAGAIQIVTQVEPPRAGDAPAASEESVISAAAVTFGRAGVCTNEEVAVIGAVVSLFAIEGMCGAPVSTIRKVG
jgi:hypothetical protein